VTLREIIGRIRGKAKAYEIKILKRRSKKYGFILEKPKPLAVSEMAIENYFKTCHKKEALLSYVIYPFLGPVENHHSNNQECFAIAEILNSLGYNVDVINWDNITFLPTKKYDLVIDNHNNLVRLADYFTGTTKKIFHATNAHWLYQNSVEYNIHYNYFLNRGIAVTPSRQITPSNSVENCDAITMFGNEFTAETYGKFRSKVYHIPMSVTTRPGIVTDRNISVAKRKFLWLNSHGALLKGMATVIDAFAATPELDLFICSNLANDGRLQEVVEMEISTNQNIKIIGWVDLEGDIFKQLVKECAWVINTSFSEGGGGSTLNCMAKGLIPLISKSASISLPDKTGFYINDNDANTLISVLKKVCLLPDDELMERSVNASNFVSENHTLEHFMKRYEKFLVDILAVSQPRLQ